MEGKANRVFHHKLGHDVVYLTRHFCDHELYSMPIEEETRDLKDKDKISEEAGRILNEAAALAQKRIRERFPEDFQKSRRLQQARKT